MVDERTQSFLVTLGINLGIALIVSFIFCYLRTRFPQVYQPRVESKWRNLYRTFSAPPPVPRGFFSWIPHTYKLTDQQIYETAGLDALMLVRFFGIMTRLFLYALIPAIAIAIPVNVTGNNRIRDPNNDLPGQLAYKTPDEFSKLSLANIANGSARMVVALLFLWFFTGLALYMSLHLWRTYMHYRHLYLSQRQLTNRHLTLLVRNLPKDYNETSVQNYFQSVYQHAVMDVTVPRNLHKLHKLTVEREAAIGKLERAYYDMEHDKQHKRPTTATRSLCCGKHDAIEHWSNRIQDLNTRILELQHSTHQLYPAAFLTLNSSLLVSTLPHIKQNDHVDEYKMKTAPDPDDVDYDALKYSRYSRFIRYILFTTATAALILFWSIPVSIAASFANLQGLADEVSWLSWIHLIPTGVINLIQGYLPAIILFLFLFLLPKILLWFAHEKGIAAYTWQQMSVIRAMFLFMVINYFLVFTFSGSLLNQLGPILNEPLSLPAILGVAFPAQATAFAEIILFRALLGFPVSALAIGGLVGYIKYRYMAKTPREKYYALHPSDVTYGSVYPTHLFILILGFVYVIIAPIVTLFALVYYLLGYTVAKYQVTYMLVPRHESGGRHWPIVFGRYITSLIVAQLTLIGLFGVKETYGPLVASVPLPFITYAFYRYVQRSYGVRSEYLPAQHSIAIDARRSTSFYPLNTLAIKQHPSEEMKNNKHDMMIDQRYRQVERDMGQAYAPNTWEWSNVSLDWDRQYLDHDELVPTATTRPTSMVERRDSGYQSTYGHDDDTHTHHHDQTYAESRENSLGPNQQYSHQIQQQQQHQQHQMHHAVEIQS